MSAKALLCNHLDRLRSFPNRKTLHLNTRGQAVVEFTLIFMLLLVVAWIPTDFGLAFYTGQLASNAAREGARIAAADPTLKDGTTTCTMPSCSGNIFQETAARLSSALLPGAIINLKLETTAEATARDPVVGYCNRMVTVSVSGNYSYFFYKLLGWMGKTVPNAVNIARSTTMRWEPQAGCGFS
jgi:Flp pilus assembly protein TadG